MNVVQAQHNYRQFIKSILENTKTLGAFVTELEKYGYRTIDDPIVQDILKKINNASDVLYYKVANIPDYTV